MLQFSSCNRVAHKLDSTRCHQANQLDLVELGLNHLGQLRRISIPACQFNYLRKESWYTTRMRIEVYVPRKEIYKRFDTKKEWSNLSCSWFSHRQYLLVKNSSYQLRIVLRTIGGSIDTWDQFQTSQRYRRKEWKLWKLQFYTFL